MSDTLAPDQTPADIDSILAALQSGERPKRPSLISASITQGWRALLKIKHVPEQLFDVTIFPIMMTLMFTYLFGGALAGSTKEYLQFFLPGILVQSIVFITMYTGVGLNVDHEKGVFDRFRSLPIWHPSAIVGPLLGDAVRYSIASTVIVVLGLILGFRPDGGVVGVVGGVVLLLVFAFSLSWIWTLFGLILRTEKSVMGVSMMLLFPLTFASNIFVSPTTMPGWLEAFVKVNPISWLVTSVRGLMHGNADGADIVKTLVASAVLVAIFAPLTMRAYRRK
ncbi:MAG TPA: ABC transporter permease [Microthrixaceae bacterium]|nr:ABC transporter permease [Microthrixaceae bacterium]HNI33746.1 ABC transporter permease [Microthrixaceae bacterium]